MSLHLPVMKRDDEECDVFWIGNARRELLLAILIARSSAAMISTRLASGLRSTQSQRASGTLQDKSVVLLDSPTPAASNVSSATNAADAPAAQSHPAGSTVPVFQYPRRNFMLPGFSQQCRHGCSLVWVKKYGCRNSVMDMFHKHAVCLGFLRSDDAICMLECTARSTRRPCPVCITQKLRIKPL